MKKLICDMTKDCSDPVSHIDSSGFIYCNEHGNQRKRYKPCRQLSLNEIKTIESGKPLTRYEVNRE